MLNLARWRRGEAFAILRQGRLLMLPRAPHDWVSSHERKVLFVHGYGAGGAVFDPMRISLEMALSVETEAIDYRVSEGFHSVARRVADRIACAADRGLRVDVVGHSLGGLISRWAIQELRAAASVDRLLTLATPHAGTRSAHMASGPMHRPMLPEGATVRALRQGRGLAGDVKYTAFVASNDRLIRPLGSAAAVEDAAVRWFDDVGHNAMLFEPEVHQAVVDVLRDGDTSA